MRLMGDEIRDLMDGKPPLRESDMDTPGSRGTGVPSAGKAPRKRPSPDADGGLEPQPGS